MPIATLGDFQGMRDGEQGADGTKMSKFGPGGIYHEKQIGKLCALHAMNNLMQGPLFDQSQLHMVANELDRKERQLMGGSNLDNGNACMDGFFNVQVIRVMLERMGYSMVQITGEEGKSALKDAAKETAYICNRREHWFALRRLGAEWFDLNSCLCTPRHFNNADVQHHINEAKREGYDVFVVRGDFPRTALEDDPKALVEAVQGCGRPGQGHSLFAGRGQALSSTAGSGGPVSAADMRAARLARLCGGSAVSAVPCREPVVPPEAPAAPDAPAPPAPPAAMPANPALEQILSMGFSPDKAKRALQAAHGNPNAAIDLLLSEA